MSNSVATSDNKFQFTMEICFQLFIFWLCKILVFWMEFRTMCNQSIWEVQNRPHTFKLALPQLSNQYHNNECQDTCNDGQCYSGDLVCVLQNDNKGKMKVDDKNIVKQNKMWVTWTLKPLPIFRYCQIKIHSHRDKKKFKIITLHI